MFSLDDLDRAAGVVRSVMPPTPQYAWPLLRQRFGLDVVVKHENHTPIGAFKVRGGLTYVERLNRERTKVKGIVSATRGNHGQSLAFAGRHFKVPVVVVVPYRNSVEKNAAMRAFGAEIVEHGIDFDNAKSGQQSSRKSVAMSTSHPSIQTSSWCRHLRPRAVDSHPDLDVVYAPIGLGSGICGLIRTRDLLGLKTDIVGVVSNLSNAYRLSFDAGRVVPINSASTFADGIAVRVPDPDAVAIIRSGARAVIEVSDHDIATAIRTYHEDTHNLAEGAGAAALAGLAVDRDHSRGRKAAVILSGGNIDRAWAILALAGQRRPSPRAFEHDQHT